MKEKSLNILIIVGGIIAILFLIWIPTAFGENINYTFDDYNDGALAGQGPWLLDDGTMSVGSSYDYDSNGKGVRGSISSFAGVYTSDISSQTSGLDGIDFYMKVNTETSYAKMRIQTTGGTENWVIGRSNTSGEYWRLQECVSTCTNVSVLSGVKNNDVWHHLYFQGRTSDGLVRAKLDDGEWSEWGGSGVFRQIESISIDGGSGEYVYYDDISLTASTPPGPVNNLSITLPENNSTTSALNFFRIQLFTDQTYATGTPHFSVYYGNSTSTWTYNTSLYGPLAGISANSTTTRDIYISDLFSIGGPYYAYASFSTSSSVIATSAITTFYISEYATSSYYTPELPATTTESFLSGCSNFGWPINWFCDAMAFLFVPNQNIMNEFMRVKNNVFVLKPFGYITLINDVWNNIELETGTTTPVIEMTSPFDENQKIKLFDMSVISTDTKNTLRNLSTWVLYLTFFGWLAETILGLFKL